MWRKGNRQSIKQKNSQRCEFFLHYFEGSGRIVSKLGNGTFAQPLRITAGGVNYTKLTAEQQKALDTYVKSLGVPPGPPTQQGVYATPEFTGDPYPTAVIKPVEENQEPPEGWPRNPIFNAPSDVPGPPVQFGPPVEPTTVKPGEGFTGIGLPENDIFYFHPDHLESTSYITAKNGSISQHVEYIAFGEVLFEEHSSSFSSPYLFNGKELDRETNLSYYGARYLDMKTSLWLNVDPLAEKYFMNSPYIYVSQNPLNLIDPTGMGEEDPPSSKLTGSKNLLVYINEPKSKTNYEQMRKASGNFDFVAVDNIDQVPGILKDHYGDKIPEINRLVIRSHGVAGKGADLDNKSGQGLVHDPKLSAGLSFLKKKLSNNATVVLTACNIIFNDKDLKASGNETEANFSNFFVGGSDRNLFLNYSKSTSRKNVAGGQVFNFNDNLAKDNYGGFAQYKDSNGSVKRSDRYSNISVSNSGSITKSTMTYSNKPMPSNYKKVKK